MVIETPLPSTLEERSSILCKSEVSPLACRGFGTFYQFALFKSGESGANTPGL
jgi:hypothetical protein